MKTTNTARITRSCNSALAQISALMGESWLTDRARGLLLHARANYTDALAAVADGYNGVALDLLAGADFIIDQAVLAQTA